MVPSVDQLLASQLGQPEPGQMLGGPPCNSRRWLDWDTSELSGDPAPKDKMESSKTAVPHIYTHNMQAHMHTTHIT